MTQKMEDAEKSSPVSKQAIIAAHKEGQTVYDELCARIKPLRKEGLVDLKASITLGGVLLGGPDTTPQGVVRTLNNVLRLREEGQFKPLTLAF